MKEMGKLESVDVKEVWDNKETVFTKWLAANPDLLGEVIGLSIPVLRAEQPTGNFRVDLVGSDESGDTIVVENQFGDSNHDHLGKLVTYLAASKAKTAVWIVENARMEHVEAISLLNQLQSMSFYLLRLEAVKIDKSRPAPRLSLIIGPSKEIKGIDHEIDGKLVEVQKKRKEFWTDLIAKLHAKEIDLFANIAPGHGSWISTGVGKAGLKLSYVIRKKDAQVELYIEKDAKFFHHFSKNKEQIESDFGEPLEWQDLPDKLAFRIAWRLNLGGLCDTDRNKLQDAMIDAMNRFEKALRPHIDSL